MGWIFFIFCAVLCSAAKDVQQSDEAPNVERDLEEFVRRLTHQPLQTTQDMQAALVPQLNLPLLRHRVDESSRDSDASISLGKFPFQSSLSRSGAHSFAIASVSQKRPDEGVEINAKASAYASVKDVNDEERLGENGVSPEEFSDQSDKVSPTTTERVEDATAPYTLKRQQTESVMKEEDSFSDIYFVAIVAGCCAAGIFGVISAGFCFYRLQKNRKAAIDVDYPAYGVTGPCKDVSSPNGDRKLAQSAQMYHYQHQKQQIIAVEKAGSTKNASASDVDSEEENEEGDYTVYECPGLAPTGEMEVKNPLFHEDSTPVSPPVISTKSDKNTNN